MKTKIRIQGLLRRPDVVSVTKKTVQQIRKGSPMDVERWQVVLRFGKTERKLSVTEETANWLRYG